MTVDLSSAKTGDSDRDAALPGAYFFNVVKFPQAHFISTALRKAGDHWIADGTLSLRGVSKPVSLAVQFVPGGQGATMDISTTLQRLNFGIGGGEYADTSVIGNDVTVTAHLLLTAP